MDLFMAPLSKGRQAIKSCTCTNVSQVMKRTHTCKTLHDFGPLFTKKESIKILTQ